MLTTYPCFAEYHYYTKQWLKRIMSLPRLDALSLKIPVEYSGQKRAFAIGSSSSTAGDASNNIYFAPPGQGNNYLPVVAFKYTNASPILDRQIPYEHVLRKRIQDNNGNVSYKLNKPMLVYELSYTASLYCALQQDSDILVFRFLSEFRPQCNLWIGEPSTEGDRDLGVYAHMVEASVTDGTEYEPADIAEKVVRKDFNWKITEAYVPTIPHEIDDKIIKDLYFELNEG